VEVHREFREFREDRAKDWIHREHIIDLVIW
jgi:hypothetical protein